MMKLVTIAAVVMVFVSSSSISSDVNLEEKLLRIEFEDLKEEVKYLQKENSDLKQKVTELQSKFEDHEKKSDDQQIKLEAEVCRVKQFAEDILKYPPFYHSCSFRSNFDSNSQVVNYENIVYETQGGVGYDEDGGMDIVNGRFTSAHAGTYQVSWHFFSHNDYSKKMFYNYSLSYW